MTLLGIASGFAVIPPRVTTWTGRSGLIYSLIIEALDQFAFSGTELHVLAKGGLVLWVGSGDELVADPMSRTRFRLAMDCADRAFRVTGERDDVARMAAIWDLEGAEPEVLRAIAA